MADGQLSILICTDPSGNLMPGLPAASSNIFQRIIRNPRPDSPHARERECTEMLAAVLINAPILRRYLLHWMARASGLDGDALDDYDYTFRTECDIEGKRDDLRIIGRCGPDDVGPPTLLWTLEVKVGSSFHVSSRLVNDDDDDSRSTPEIDAELVHQIKNYDGWLGRQSASHRAGFVLALRDVTPALPEGLRCSWTCLTWTGMGLELERLIAEDDVPPEDQFLAKHLLGFIRANLWRTDEMEDAIPKLDFNDIALIRAFAKIGRDCGMKINSLLADVPDIICKAGIGHGDPTTWDSLFKSLACSGVYRYLVSSPKDSDPFLNVAVGYYESLGDYMGVFIEMSPRQPKSKAVRQAAKSTIPKLRERNGGWNEGADDDDDVTVLQLSLPLTDLLAAKDQSEAVAKFVQEALLDLRESGVLDAISAVMGKSKGA